MAKDTTEKKFRKGDILILFAQFVIAFLLFELNHLTGFVLNRGDYTPFSGSSSVSAQVYDQGQLYIPGPQRFARESKTYYEMDVWELRETVNGNPTLHIWLFGWFAKSIGSLETVWMLFNGLLPACQWFLVFLILPKFASLSIRSLTAWGVVLFAFGPRNLLLLGKYALIQPLEATRMPQPALSFLVLLVAIGLVSYALERQGPCGWVWAVLAGFASGLCFYSYYFYWLGLFLGLGSLCLLSLRFSPMASLRLCVVLVVGCIVGSPFIWRIIQAQRFGTQRPLLERVGGFHHSVDFTGILLALTLIVLLLWMIKRLKDFVSMGGLIMGDWLPLILASVLLGGAFGLNFQLVSGYDAQHGHFWNRLIQPIGLLLAAIELISILKRFSLSNQILINKAAIVGCLIMITLGAFRQAKVGESTKEDHRYSRPVNQVLVWLRENVPPESVVGSLDSELIALTPGVAGTWCFVPVGDRSVATDREILTRAVIAGWLESRTKNDLVNYLTNRSYDKPSWHYPSYFLLLLQGPVPSKILLELQELIDNVDPSLPLGGRRLDYYVIPSSCSFKRLGEAFPKARMTFKNSDWLIFELNS